MFHSESEGHYCHRLCTAKAPFWSSRKPLWILIVPFWLSTEDMIDWMKRRWPIPPQHLVYHQGTSIRQAPVFLHLRALRKSPWKIIIRMNEYNYTACCWFSTFFQQYNTCTSITVLTNQVWKLLIALFKVPNTGALTVHAYMYFP